MTFFFFRGVLIKLIRQQSRIFGWAAVRSVTQREMRLSGSSAMSAYLPARKTALAVSTQHYSRVQRVTVLHKTPQK